jgi:hypothetical protein
MLPTILLYGATGYSGRLIAAEARRRGMTRSNRTPRYRMVLAGRNYRRVSALAQSLNMEPRSFGLDDREAVLARLRDVDVILNAAGPFANTAPILARAALGARCHYVDINGEPDVYLQLDDLGRGAVTRRVVMVSGAGYTSAASDLLLDVALAELRSAAGASGATGTLHLGAIRIGMSHVASLSRGSLETLWRSLREQVRIVRVKRAGHAAPGEWQHTFWHIPVGQLERTFDYTVPPRRRESGPCAPDNVTGKRIASAANVLDTITARRTAERQAFISHRIESYAEVDETTRVVFQAAPLITPWAATSLAQDVVGLQLSALPNGPTPHERRTEDQVLVLEIEDRFQSRVVHWAWRTPNPYDFTARVALETAVKVVDTTLVGWRTPAELLVPKTPEELSTNDGYLRGCALQRRPAAVAEFAS